ncbi:hypothetical protein GCM10010349_74650 [Streptomyces flavofungini]|nr:hypothetical protein GCM10010349_74650 [Streptomyces flavofungini]
MEEGRPDSSMGAGHVRVGYRPFAPVRYSEGASGPGVTLYACPGRAPHLAPGPLPVGAIPRFGAEPEGGCSQGWVAYG